MEREIESSLFNGITLFRPCIGITLDGSTKMLRFYALAWREMVALEHLEIMWVWKENQNVQKYVLNKYLFLKLLLSALFS